MKRLAGISSACSRGTVSTPVVTLATSVGWVSSHMCIGACRNDVCRAEANASGLNSFLALPIVIKNTPELVSTETLDRMAPATSPRARERTFWTMRTTWSEGALAKTPRLPSTFRAISARPRAIAVPSGRSRSLRMQVSTRDMSSAVLTPALRPRTV